MSFAVADEVQIISWGNNSSGQLFEMESSGRVNVSAGAWASYVYGLNSVESIGCMREREDYGQCDLNIPESGYTAQYGGLRTTSKPFLYFDSTYAHGCGVNASGVLECVGCGRPYMTFQCDVGNDAKVINEYDQLSDVLSVAPYSSCYIDEDGFAKCVGCDSEGASDAGNCAPPQNIKFKIVRAGTSVSGGITTDFDLVLWGDAGFEYYIPEGVKAIDLAVGPNTICYIDLKNKIHCTPITMAEGMMGDESESESIDEDEVLSVFDDSEGMTVKIDLNKIPTNKMFKKVLVGRSGVCGLDMDGYLDCWGCPISEMSVCDLPYRPMRVFDFDLSYEHVVAMVPEVDVPEDYEVPDSDWEEEFVVMEPSDALDTKKYDFINHVGMKFKTIHTGEFYKGSCGYPFEEKENIIRRFYSGEKIDYKKCQDGYSLDLEALENEFPQHKVVIDYDYQLALFEVTIGEFNRFIEESGYEMPEEYFEANSLPEHYPVSYVNLHDAESYVKWLNDSKPSTDSGVYRLPSESEWEYAARDGVKTVYPWGDKMVDGMANCRGCGVENKKQSYPVGGFPPSKLGLYDMLGNVDEWTTDCMSQDYNKTPRDGSSNKAIDCSDIVVKGGSWEYGIENLRPAWRDYYGPGDRTDEQGFRVLREIPQ